MRQISQLVWKRIREKIKRKRIS